jgi:cytochrome c oxidase cbb3-type subunit 3
VAGATVSVRLAVHDHRVNCATVCPHCWGPFPCLAHETIRHRAVSLDTTYEAPCTEDILLNARLGNVSWQAWRIVASSALALVLGYALARHWHAQSKLRAALLTTLPDDIPSDPILYARANAVGRPAFLRYCSGCHGARGEPDTLRGVPDLRDHDWLYGSGRVIEIERVLLYGIRAGNAKGWDLASMPAFATANPYDKYKTESLPLGEIDDVSEFLYSLRHQGFDAEAAARGRRVYFNQSRALCWDCHSQQFEGDTAIGAPNLNDTIWLYGDGSRRSIRDSISYGRKGRCPAWIGKLSFGTIRALAVYTYSLSNPQANATSIR